MNVNKGDFDTQIGEIAKAFTTKHLKYLKTKDKTSIYTHIQVKQSSENNRIIVLVHDIVMRKWEKHSANLL